MSAFPAPIIYDLNLENSAINISALPTVQTDKKVRFAEDLAEMKEFQVDCDDLESIVKCLQHLIYISKQHTPAVPAFDKAGPTEYLGDTGAGDHMISLSELPDFYENLVRDLDNPVVLNTANGLITVTQYVTVQLPLGNEQTIDMLLLPETPAVISIGKLCNDHDFIFHWPRNQDPYLEDTNGNRIYMIVRNNVPYIIDDGGICITAVKATKHTEADASGDVVDAAPGECVKGSSKDIVIQDNPPPAPTVTGAQEKEFLEKTLGIKKKTKDGTAVDAAGESPKKKPKTKSTPKEKPRTEGTPTKKSKTKGKPIDTPRKYVPTETPHITSDGTVGPKMKGGTPEHAVSLAHLMTHRFKNCSCEGCQVAGMQRKQHRAKNEKRSVPDLGEKPENFGEAVTLDHLINRKMSHKDDWAIDPDKTCAIIHDIGTTWTEAHPKGTKSQVDTSQALAIFSGNKYITKLYSDNAPEIKKAAEQQGILVHDTSIPGVHETNAIAERRVRKCLNGTRIILYVSGIPISWWPMAIKHYCLSCNIEIMEDGRSAWSRRHNGRQFPGKRIPFGALIAFKPQNDHAKNEHKMAPIGLPGIFMGYKMLAGGKWGKGYLVCDLRNLRGSDGFVKPYTEIEKAIKIQTTDTVWLEDESNITFPLKAAHDEYHKTLKTFSSIHTGTADDMFEVKQADSNNNDEFPTKSPEAQIDEQEQDLVDSIERKPEEVSKTMEQPQEEKQKDKPPSQTGADTPGKKDGGNGDEETQGGKRICSECGQPGHYRTTCPEVYGTKAYKRKMKKYLADIKEKADAAKDRDNSATAAPAPSSEKITIIEFCCENDSRMGRRAPKNVEVVRLTISDDLTTVKGYAKAKLAALTRPNVHLWGSIPCTGGSPLQEWNAHLPGHKERMKEHFRIFTALWKNFMKIAYIVKSRGGTVSNEWPTSCRYWGRSEVADFVHKFGLVKAKFHGCQFGLKSIKPKTKGMPILKPWTVATDN